jgi:hypothetical protein
MMRQSPKPCNQVARKGKPHLLTGEGSMAPTVLCVQSLATLLLKTR